MADKIRGITIELTGDTSKLTQSLKGVNSEIKSTQRQLKDVERLLKLDPKNTELLRQKQSLLKQAIAETKDKLAELKNIQSTMDAQGVDKNSEQYRALQREIIETEQNLRSLEREYRAFGSVAAQQIAYVGQKMQEAGQKVTAFGKTLTATVTVPITAAATASAKKFADFDKTMQLVKTTMGLTEAEAANLESAIAAAAAESIFGMSDAAVAALNFARAGLSATEAAEMLKPAMDLAAGAGGDLDTVSAGLVATINGFGDSFSNAAMYADIFAAACNNSALDVDSLAQAMSIAAPIFRTAGYNVRDAALYMGVMADAGIDANTAANALKTGIARLAKPSKEAAEAMKQYGIEVFNADGTMKDSIEVQRILHDSFANLSEEEQIAAASAIFGKNQMSNWLALINTAPEEVQELSDSLSNCAGTTNEMAEAMMSGFGGAIERLKSSLDVLMTEVGKIVAEIISPVIDKIQEWINKFLALDDKTKKLIVTIALIVAAAGPLLIILGSVMQGLGAILSIVPAVVGAISSIMGILASLFTFVVANPIVLVIAAIVAAVAGATYLIITHLDEIKAAFRNEVEQFKAGLQQTKAEFQAFGAQIKAGVQSIFNAIATLASRIASAISSAINSAINSVVSAVNSVVSWVNSVIASIGAALGGVGGRTTSRVRKMATGGTLLHGSAVVGDAGPELLTIVGGGAQVTPLTGNQAKSAMKGAGMTAGGVTKVVINYTGSLAQLARVLQPEIQVETGRRGPQLINT